MDPNAQTAKKLLPNFNGKKLSSPTFQEWRIRIVSQCRDKGIQEALQAIPAEQTAAKLLAYFKADNSLYNIIISNLSGEALLFASQNFEVKEDTAPTAYLGNKLWEALKTKYSGRVTDQEAHVMEMKVLTAKCDKNVPSYVQYIQTHRFNFISKTNADEEQTLALDKKIVQTVLIGLPKSYQTFVSIQRAKDHPSTLAALIEAVEIEERSQESTSMHEVALGTAAMAVGRGGHAARARGRGGRGGVYADRISLIKKAKNAAPVKELKYFSDFVLDSGATQHSTHSPTDIDSGSFQTCSETILSANDSEMTCSGKGDVNIQTGKSMLTLKDVRLILSSKLKLISLELLLKDKYTITSESSELLVLSQNNRPKLVFQIPNKGPRLYHLVQTALSDHILSAVAKEKTIVSPDQFAFHHFKLGHLNNQDLASALRSNGLTVTNETMKGFVCEHCLLSKSTTKAVTMPQSSIASKDTTNPGDWIHSDLTGPEPSYNTTKYAMDFVDEISGLIAIQLLDHQGTGSKSI